MQNIVVCVEEWVDPLTLIAYEGAEDINSGAVKQKQVRKDDGADAIRFGGASDNAGLNAELRQEEPLELPGILGDIVDALSVLRSGPNHFLRYITTEDIGKEFDKGRVEHLFSYYWLIKLVSREG